jgi:predicted membrane-bound mannosyltransferase
MSEEEAQTIRQLIREELSGLVDIQAADGVRITRTEETAQTLLAITQNLVTLAQSHDERMDALTATVERLSNTVERYITARGNNGSSGQ